MQLSEQRHGAVTVVKPDGPINAEGADAFKDRLRTLADKSLGKIIVDAADVPYVDSRGLEVLVEVTDELSRIGQALHLCATNDTLREVFQLTGLTSKFEFFEDATSAVRSFL